MSNTSHRAVVEVRRNPFNSPIAVKWTTSLQPQVDGIRHGEIEITMSSLPRAVVFSVLVNASGVVFEDSLQGRYYKEGWRGGINVPLSSSALPAFARTFIAAVKIRFEEQWANIFSGLTQEGQILLGNGQFVIAPTEWGQAYNETYERPWFTQVSVPMGGQGRR